MKKKRGPKLKPNEFSHLDDGVTALYIVRRDGSEHTVWIETTDFDLVKGHRWRVSNKTNQYSKTQYVVTHKPGTRSGIIYMHRLILRMRKGKYGDHINRDGLDNRLSNLRKATAVQNGAHTVRVKLNQAGYRGVQVRRKRFAAYIGVKSSYKYIGTYKTIKAAARAYDKAAKKYHGEFAELNFPKKPTEIRSHVNLATISKPILAQTA